MFLLQESGADCVKFQKSCLYEKFTKQALEAPYKNKNSWGQTYGDHKKHLEFSEDQYLILQKYAEEMGILFTASAMDPVNTNLFIIYEQMTHIPHSISFSESIMIATNFIYCVFIGKHWEM